MLQPGPIINIVAPTVFSTFFGCLEPLNEPWAAFMGNLPGRKRFLQDDAGMDMRSGKKLEAGIGAGNPPTV
jgi:hypothetical protein